MINIHKLQRIYAMPDTFMSPWQYPDISRLEGRFVTVERLNPTRDIEDLYSVSHIPAEYQSLYTHMTFGPFQSKFAMLAWLNQVAGSRDPL
jgi:hypothetical protein